MKQTKIVASISDRRCDQDFIRKLFFAGMNVVRMNTCSCHRRGYTHHRKECKSRVSTYWYYD